MEKLRVTTIKFNLKHIAGFIPASAEKEPLNLEKFSLQPLEANT